MIATKLYGGTGDWPNRLDKLFPGPGGAAPEAYAW